MLSVHNRISNLGCSAARIKNASVHVTNEDELLAPVLKSDGTRSELFPADLRTLLSYDCELLPVYYFDILSTGDIASGLVELVKGLVRDYELPEDMTVEMNLDRFMKHIGIQLAKNLSCKSGL